MKKPKGLLLILCVLIPPLGLLYLFLIACQAPRPWPAGMKQIRYAHRGLHHQPDQPENSLAAFRSALDAGFGAELDVHLMKDGSLAVIHDSSLLRTAGAEVEIEDLTREDLEAYRLEETNERIPLLEEVLEIFEDGTPLVVELKTARSNHEALAEAACKLLDRYDVTYCIESFDPRAIQWLKKNRPDIIRGQLSGHLTESGAPYSKQTLWLLSNLFMNVLSRPDFIAYDHHYRQNLSLKLARLIFGVQEVSWTVRSPEEAAALEAEDCLIIFENFL